jgi:CRP-like cAMP-binding protein
MAPVTAVKKRRKFNSQTISLDHRRRSNNCNFRQKQRVFAQGDPSDAVFYIQKGKVKLGVVSKGGKEAAIGNSD